MASDRTVGLGAGMLMSAWVPVGGQLFVFEALAPLVIVAKWRSLEGDPWASRLTMGAVLWASGQLMSDLANGVSLSSLLSGQALIWFLLLDFLALRALCARRPRRCGWLVLGYGLSQAINFMIQPNAYAAEMPWKFGIGLAASFTLAGLVFLLGRRFLVASLGGLAVVNLWFGFRSQSLVLSLTAAFAMLAPRFGRRASVLAGLLVIVAVLGVGSAIYGQAALSGYLGEDARTKYLYQATSDIGLAGARPEFVFAAAAIAERPVLGIGSDARDPGNVIRAGHEALVSVGFQPAPLRDPYSVPLHSHALGAWAMAGVLALPFWALVAVIVWSAFTALGQVDSATRVLLGFALFNASWDILFSPLGSFGRFQLALELVTILTITETLLRHESFSRHNLLQSGQVSRAGHSLRADAAASRGRGRVHSRRSRVD